MAHIEQIIEKPLITEKASLISEKQNRYGFKSSFKGEQKPN